MSSTAALVVLCATLAFSFWMSLRTSRPPPIANFALRPVSRFRKATAPPTTLALRDKTAVVTGAAGFLGSNLVEQLLVQGWDVTALVRPRTNVTLLQQIAVAAGASARLHVAEGDVSDYASLQRAVPNNVAVVFHVAAVVSLWNARAQQCYDVNVLGTRNVVDVCLEKNVQKLVHTSSN